MVPAESDVLDDARYAVTAVERRTPTIVEIWLSPVAEPIEYLPGQYVLLEEVAGDVPPRSYSIANAPRLDGAISLLVTRVPDGQTSGWVHDHLAVGDRVSLSGPYGTFVAAPAATGPCLYLAAGSGLAPIRALVEAAVADTAARELVVVFSARTEAGVLDRERFAHLEATCPGFRFLRTLTREPGTGLNGRIPRVLSTVCGDLAEYEVFIAGAAGFVRDCASAAEAAGAARTQVHTEAFFAEPPVRQMQSTTHRPLARHARP